MATEIVFTDDGRGVIIAHTGIVNGEDVVSALQSVMADSRYPTVKYWISDRTGCTKYDVSTEQVTEIAKNTRAARNLNPSLLVALVSPSALQFGISRMLQNLTDEELSTTLVCESRDEADAWIIEQLNRA